MDTTKATDLATLESGKSTIVKAAILHNEDNEITVGLRLQGISRMVYVGLAYVYRDLELMLPTKSLHKAHLMLLQGAEVTWTLGRILQPEIEYTNSKGDTFTVQSERIDLQGLSIAVDYASKFEFASKLPTNMETVIYSPELKVVKKDTKDLLSDKETESLFDESLEVVTKPASKTSAKADATKSEPVQAGLPS